MKDTRAWPRPATNAPTSNRQPSAQPAPFKFALAAKKPGAVPPASANGVVQQKAADCGCKPAGAPAPALKVPPVYRPQPGKPAMQSMAQSLQAKAAPFTAVPMPGQGVPPRSMPGQTIQRSTESPPSYTELQSLHQKWDRDYANSQKKDKDDEKKDDGDKGGGKKPGFTFKKGATKGTCYSGRDCTGSVLSHPHHKHNCCGGRRSSGGSYRDHTGSCSNC